MREKLGGTQHLKQRGTTYHWRRKVPLHLQHRFGVGELCKTLRTGSAKQAQELARQLSVASDQLFIMVKHEQALTIEDTSRLARQWLNDVLERAEHAYAGAGVKTPDLLTMRRGRGEDNEKTWSAMLAANDLAIAEGTARKIVEDAGISIPADPTIFADLCRKLLRATIEGSRVLRARLEGRYDYVAQDPLFRDLQPAADHRPTPPVKDHGPRLSDLIKKHVASGKRTWTSQTLNQNEATFRLFKDYVSDPLVGSIDRADISAFLNALACLPNRYGQLSL